MRAAVLRETTGPDGVSVASGVDVPDREPGKLLIAVNAAGVTFPDVLVARGRYQDRPALPYIPGLEVAGVVQWAPEESRFRVGDRIAAACMGGGFAEFVNAEERLAIRVPDGMSDEAASGLAINYGTMHFALHRRGGLRAGERVLILGAGGGIGTAAIELARAAGAMTIALCRGSEKADLCRSMGADVVIDTETLPESLPAAVREVTDGRGVDVVVDPVGGDGWMDALRSLAPEGRLLVIGFAGGVPAISANRLLLRNVSAVGVGWGAFLAHTPQLAEEVGREIEQLADRGLLHPAVGSIWPLAEAGEALRALEERRVVGRAVVRVRGSDTVRPVGR